VTIKISYVVDLLAVYVCVGVWVCGCVGRCVCTCVCVRERE